MTIPPTRAWKRGPIAEAGIDIPQSLAFVPVDFETDALATRLASVEFSRVDPAVFVWLGIVFYLTPAAVRTTLSCIANQAQTTEVIFDYLHPADTDEDRKQLGSRSSPA